MKLYRKIRNSARGFFLERRIQGLMRPYETIVPTHLAIETTNFCNGKCVFCPSTAQTRSRGVMSMELLEKIINDAKGLDSIEFVTHGGMGEPLMDEKITDKIKIEKAAIRAPVQLHTNGSLLNEDNIRKLFDSGLDILSVSLNAYHGLTHEAVTGLDYGKVLQNVENAFRMKAQIKADTDIRITMVKTEDMSQEEVSGFKRHWSRFTPSVKVHSMKNWGCFSANLVEGRKYPCKWIWYMMSVEWDGRVSICHEDFDGSVIIGDLNHDRIIDVFNCETIKGLRETFYEGGFPSLGLCRDCSRLHLDKSFWRGAQVTAGAEGVIKYS